MSRRYKGRGWYKYAKFIRRVHKFITAVLIAEKEERAKRKKVVAATLGYDPEKWIKNNAKIRSEDTSGTTYQNLKMSPPTKGRHRFSHCQQIYENIHSFLHQREWAHAHPKSTHSGITWLELFVLFDTGGYRSNGAQHIRDREALRRASARKKMRSNKDAKASEDQSERRHEGDEPCDIQQIAAIAKPTLDQELKAFKAIARHITKHDLDDRQRKWFQMEKRSNLRRLGSLGIIGNQPAMAAMCKLDQHEKLVIAEAILQQKVGANAKAAKQYHEHVEREKHRGTEQEEGKLLLKYARVANGAVVRWRRKTKTTTCAEGHTTSPFPFQHEEPQ